jgi:O-antigen ligase
VAVGAALLVLVAIFWGGATTRLAQAVVLAGLGALWLLAPLRQWPSRGLVVCGGGLIALAAVTWLPVEWFPVEPWRRGLQSVGILLPSTLSPQPWLSAEAFVWLLAGLGWLAWLLGQGWTPAMRQTVARILAGGMVLIAATALLAWVGHFSVPGWLSDRRFGPFPNRNHTGHVFALGGILALGCAADAARNGWLRALPWLTGAGVVLVALVVNYSRGGLLLFFGAIVIWAALEAWRRRSWPVLAVGASLVLVLASLVLIGGGALAARFAGGADSQVAFRTLIWRDTLALIHASPWCGVGLGNFRALFSFYRAASINQQSVWHPESDWLWLAVEMGWLGVVLALALAVVVLRGAFPLAAGSRRRLRAAALAAAIAALLHSTFDVPGHRVGSALMAMFVMVLARRDAVAAPVSRVVAILWRAGGLATLAVAVMLRKMPDEAARAETLSQAGQYAAAEAAANRALTRAPLDWAVYFTRAGERASQGRTLEAVADFRRARVLEPHFAMLPLAEGRFWIHNQPMLAVNAWREALHRARPPEDEVLYGAMLDAAPDSAKLREQLLMLAEARPPLQLLWFQFAPVAEARLHLEELSVAAQQCDPKQRAAFERRAHEIGNGPLPP